MAVHKCIVEEVPQFQHQFSEPAVILEFNIEPVTSPFESRENAFKLAPVALKDFDHFILSHG